MWYVLRQRWEYLLREQVEMMPHQLTVNPRGGDRQSLIGEPTDKLRELPRLTLQGQPGQLLMGRKDWLREIEINASGRDSKGNYQVGVD